MYVNKIVNEINLLIENAPIDHHNDIRDDNHYGDGHLDDQCDDPLLHSPSPFPTSQLWIYVEIHHEEYHDSSLTLVLFVSL